MQVPWDLWSKREQGGIRYRPRSLRLGRPMVAPARSGPRHTAATREPARVSRARGGSVVLPQWCRPGCSGPLHGSGSGHPALRAPDEWTFVPRPARSAPMSIGRAPRPCVSSIAFRGRRRDRSRSCSWVTSRGRVSRPSTACEGREWPDWLPRYGFETRDDRLNTTTETLRRPEGGIRLVFCFDTWLPEYAVRYPLQGFRFEGEARVRTAVLRPRGTSPSRGERGMSSSTASRRCRGVAAAPAIRCANPRPPRGGCAATRHAAGAA